MSSGPILIYDKSALEAVSLDECAWLAQFYRANVTPVFFVETIADLEKEFKERAPESVVARLALKTSAMTADANSYHARMCVADLLGEVVEMRGVPVIEGGRSVAQAGKKGLVFKPGPETEMLGRWQRRRFSDQDRATARAWRNSLEELDLDRIYTMFRRMVEAKGKPRDFAGVKAMSDEMLSDASLAERILGLALISLSIPHEVWGDIFNRWKQQGGPVLAKFAPYAAHCYGVDLFFSIAVGSDLISKDRPSNKADMAYLYYLPFCMVFTSGDKLHENTVPLFLRADQTFVRSGELKADLKRLDEYYSMLPDDVKAGGIMSFAPKPPLEGDFLVTKLWDKHLRPVWRESRKAKPERSADAEAKLIREMREMASGTDAGERVHLEDADFVVMERFAPVQVGKWRVMPPGVEDSPKNRGE